MVGIAKLQIDKPDAKINKDAVPQAEVCAGDVECQISSNRKSNGVIMKIRSSMKSLKFPRDFFGSLTNGYPDLRAAATIIITMIVTIELHKSLLDYLLRKDRTLTHYDYHMVYGTMLSIIYYVWTSPLLLILLIKLNTQDAQLKEEANIRSVLSLLGLYALRLSTYAQFPMVWISKVYWLQWLRTLSSTLLSAGATIVWLRSLIERTKHSYVIIVIILAMHVTEAVVFVLFVFEQPMIPVTAKNVTVTELFYF